MSRDGIRRRKKPEKNESSEGALKCICKKKDDRGMMIQCEACLIWQHTRCLGMEENSLPPHYICSACLKPTEPLPQKFDFILDAGLRKSFEEDLIQMKDKPKDAEVKRHRVFSVMEKQLIEKYFGRYVESKESKEKENIVSGVAMLLNCSLYGVGNLFKFLAEEITGANKDDDSSDEEEEEEDPYKDWNLIKKNIYSDGIEALSNGQVLDTDMQEPVKLTIMRIDDEWGVVVRDSVEKNQYIAEYLGVWLASRKPCVEDLSPSSRFILAHPFCSSVCIDARRSGSTIRFVRRSCKPNTQFKEVISPDNTRHLALFAIEPLAADTEITVAFDRNWKTYSCNIKCACDTSDCIVKEWYDKRSSLAANLLDSFIKRKTLLKLKNASRNEPDSDADESESLTDQEEENENEESEDDDEEEEEEEDEDEDEPRRNAKKKNKGDKKENVKAPAPSGNMSREERKLQLIMRSIEKMENRERMASMSGKKRKPEIKSDKRRPSEESRKRLKTSDVPSTKTQVVKKERGTQNQKASRITSPKRNSTITSPRASDAKKVLVRTEKRRKSIGEVASPPPSSTDTPTSSSSSASSRVSPSSPSPPPTSTPNTTKFGKKAWLQEYEEKKQMSKSNSEVPTKNTSPTPTISISSSASSVPVLSPSTPSSFPLKKKMLDAFLSSTAQRTAETESKPEKPEPTATPKKLTTFDSQDRRDSVDSLPAFRSFSRDQTSSPKPTSSSPNTTQSPTKNGVTEDPVKFSSALPINGKRTQGSSDGADAMEIDNEVTPQQNSILYVSPQPPRNNISSRQAPIPRSPSPPRTNHSPPQHYASQPPVASSLSPHKSYVAPPPHPSFHHSSRPGPPMAQGPMMNGGRPPYPNGRLQKPPPYPSGPTSYGNHNNNNTWSNGRVNGVIGASGVMRSHDRYIRRSDGYY